MTRTTAHRPDVQLLQAVTDELRWTPAVDAGAIGVSVSDGAVTLTGTVPSYPEKLLAGKAALRVRGVTALAQELAVHSRFAETDDADVAREAAEALRTAVNVPDTVQATVSHHVITLTGDVAWHVERVAAGRAVRYLRGVTGVANTISIRPRAVTADIRTAIDAALARSAELEATRITVSTGPDGVVTLEGTVRFWAERRQAERAAFSAPGVTTVTNHLRVEG